MVETIRNGKIRTCDNCRRELGKWEGLKLMKQERCPGKNFDKCSSDIKLITKTIVKLCPECVEELEELYSINRKEKCV